MQTCDPIAAVTSAAWAAATPEVSVVIATHNRSGYLAELLDALSRQVGEVDFEVVVADDGSEDDTWPVLEELAATTGLAMTALRLPTCNGPSVPRNTAVGASRGAIIAFTDDDCLPTSEWLAALLPAAQAGRIVQGATVPAAHGRTSPWDRTISIGASTGLWESCNLALPRELFTSAGGFPVLDLLGEQGRGFGEDAMLGATAERMGGGNWAPAAVVLHRWLPGDYRSHLDAMRRLEAMPALVGLIPELREHCFARLFRSRRSAACDAALAGVAVAIVVRRKAPLAAAIPWLGLTASAAVNSGTTSPSEIASRPVRFEVVPAALRLRVPHR